MLYRPPHSEQAIGIHLANDAYRNSIIEKIKENQIAERLGLSPEHLSLVKNSKAVADKRLVGHIELLAQV